jgi:hypothetical protein
VSRARLTPRPRLVRVEVYVAGSCSSGTLLDPAVWRAWVGRIAADLGERSGGGCTIHAPATGYWRGQSEPVQVVEAFMPEAKTPGARRGNADVLLNYLVATHQETVLVVVDGVAHFLTNDCETPPGG